MRNGIFSVITIVIEKKITYVLKTKDVNLFSKEDVEKYGFQIISFK